MSWPECENSIVSWVPLSTDSFEDIFRMAKSHREASNKHSDGLLANSSARLAGGAYVSLFDWLTSRGFHLSDMVSYE